LDAVESGEGLLGTGGFIRDWHFKSSALQILGTSNPRHFKSSALQILFKSSLIGREACPQASETSPKYRGGLRADLPTLKIENIFRDKHF
jgi:hypothetical protein